ncbi:Helicase associated domain protein [Streptomyces niveus]|uniref:Helicase associated domain protein n=1 Tax=Streptomyces niveus TaxID=193462 RepID=UPI0036627E1D
MTFHHRVADARAFATTLTDTALPADLQPDGLWSQWISGTHPPRVRRRILLEFAAHTHPDQPAILANARVLGEGIDVPSIDAVVFADPKNSPVDTVQAVGRALCQHPGAGKKATLIVPVYLTPDEDPDDLLGADAYTPLWRTVQALRAHDERLTARLADPRTHRPTRIRGPQQLAPLRTPDQGRGNRPRPHPARPRPQKRRMAPRPCRRLPLPPHPPPPRRPPQTYEDNDGYPLGRLLTWQRHLHTTGVLDPAKRAALDRLSIIWNPHQQAFDRGLAHAAAYAARHGHLSIPVDHLNDGYPLGRWLATQRKRAGQLTPARKQALNDLDPHWNPPWPLTWQRSYHAARRYAEAGNSPSFRDLPRTYVTSDGHRLGEWLHTQRASTKALHTDQRQLLTDLGLPPQPQAPGKPASEKGWNKGLRAAKAFHAREGHLHVPQRHVEDLDGDPVRLGQWISNTRRRKERLSAQRTAALDALGMQWPRTEDPS